MKYRSSREVDLHTPKMSVSLDEMNYLVWRYMQENGFPHAAYVFDTESQASSTNIPGSQVPPGGLISLLQKSLIYLKIEKSIREKSSTNPDVRAEIENIQKAFPTTQADPSTSEGIIVNKLTNENSLILKGSSRAICCIQFSPDGEKVATLQSDNICTIWTDNGRKSVTCGRVSDEIVRCRQSISWNSTSDLIAVAGDSQTTIYNLAGQAACLIPSDSSVVQFCADMPLLVTCSKSDYSVAIWEVRDSVARRLENFSIHRDIIYDVVWRDHGTVATASGDRRVGLFTVGGGGKLFMGHAQPVTTVQFSPSGALLASGSDDGTVYVWKDGHQSAVLKGHSSGITAIAWHPTIHTFVASASTDGTVKVWDAISGECHATIAHHSKAVTTLEFHPSGEYLATGSMDKIVGIWKYPEGQMIHAFTTGHIVNVVKFDAAGANLAVCFDSSFSVVLSMAEYLH